MSDTRAAIRELRSLSEKRSLSTLSEAETARWMALRRQLGLPLEPPPEDAPPPSPAAADPWEARPPSTPAAAPGPPAASAASETSAVAPAEGSFLPSTPVEAAAAAAFAGEAPVAEPTPDPLTPSGEPLPGDSASEAPPVGEPTGIPWAGLALDTPATHRAGSWVGPAIDAPAWSDAEAERITDPGLEEPPPIPFDEAPAARPHPGEVVDLSGRADEPVPLASAVEFVSYAREGSEAIDLPPEGEHDDGIERRGLAELAGMGTDLGARERTAAAAEPGSFDGEYVEQFAPLPPEQLEGEAALESPLAPLEATGPVQLDPPVASPEAEPFDDREYVERLTPLPVDHASLLPEAPAPPPLELPVAAPEAGPFDSGLLSETPAPPPLDLPVAAPEAGPFDSGLLSETPAPPPLDLLVAPPQAGPFDSGLLSEALVPLPPQLTAPHAAPGPEESGAPFELAPPDTGVVAEPSAPFDGLADEAAPLQLGPPLPDEPPARPVPVSTWAPGAGAPPVLAADDFGHTGDPLTAAGLDPWPEAQPPVAEEVVETVGDEDLVEDLSTPTPLPPLQRTQTGSGGIRGFQFPRPPGPVAVPVPPAPPRSPTRTTSIAVPAPKTPVPPTSFAPLSTRPAPPAAVPPSAVAPVTPRPAAPQPQSVHPAAAARVPLPPAPVPARVQPSAVAPVTPRPPASPQPPPPPAAVVPAPPPAAFVPAPVPPSSVAPLTPRPPAPPVPVPPAAVAPVTPRPAFQARTPTPRPAPAVMAPPVLAAQPPRDDEAALPLLELVDEVEPGPAVPPHRHPSVATPTPAAGTTGMFGPPAAMLNPGFVEGDHRVVVHTLEGQVHRGTVHDLDLHDEAIPVLQPDGRAVRIPSRRVKAVFFVLAPGGTPPRPRGDRVQVTFRDGRQVVGYSDDHASGDPGFFVVPSDARTNTARVFVFRGGIQSITAG